MALTTQVRPAFSIRVKIQSHDDIIIPLFGARLKFVSPSRTANKTMEIQEDSCEHDNGDPKPTSSRKKIKADLLESGNWDRCMQFLPKKKRYCNMARTDGSEYCGVHMSTSKRGDRIPCPIDPSHTVWSLQLNAHLKICNVVTANQQLVQQPYYSEVCLICFSH